MIRCCLRTITVACERSQVASGPSPLPEIICLLPPNHQTCLRTMYGKKSWFSGNTSGRTVCLRIIDLGSHQARKNVHRRLSLIMCPFIFISYGCFRALRRLLASGANFYISEVALRFFAPHPIEFKEIFKFTIVH